MGDNGRLTDAELVDVDGTRVALVAAADLRRLLDAFRERFGRPLRPPEGYRTYERQEALFLDRHTTTPLEGRPTATWRGETWYRRPDVAHCAVPGASPHGLGLAIDLTLEDAEGEGGDWLRDGRCGWRWPAWARDDPTCEPWHLEHDGAPG